MAASRSRSWTPRATAEALDGLNALSLAETAALIARGSISAEAVVQACLERIAAREPTVRAWAFIDPEHALAQARARDAQARARDAQARARDAGPANGPLHGVPIGVKDIFDTFDMPTAMGSPIYAGHRPPNDAACVAIARAAGAVILGKTVTAEFAGTYPGATTNPHDPARTPGGSSQGSAAAVADHMVMAAYGTQTGGSVLRPASYCGIVGFKPSYGTFSRVGVKFAAESLDTIGIHTRTLEDTALLRDVLIGVAPAGLPARETAPRIGLCRTHLWRAAEPATVAAVESAARTLADAGATVSEATLPDGFTGLGEARRIVNDYERARAMAHEWHTARDLLSDQMARTVASGFAVADPEYRKAQAFMAACRERLEPVFEDHDVLLAPCVNGEAPVGLDYAGDPAFQALWTLLHVPAITLPTHRGPAGLPVGIQLLARRGGDDGLLAAANWVWEKIGGQC